MGSQIARKYKSVRTLCSFLIKITIRERLNFASREDSIRIRGLVGIRVLAKQRKTKHSQIHPMKIKSFKRSIMDWRLG